MMPVISAVLSVAISSIFRMIWGGSSARHLRRLRGKDTRGVLSNATLSTLPHASGGAVRLRPAWTVEGDVSKLGFERSARIYVAGHGGLVGSAVWRELQRQGYSNLVGWRSAELDLRNQEATRDALLSARPDAVVLVACP